MPSLSLLEVDQIASLQEPILRNLQITQCYAELSAAIGGRLAGEANWCSFATWASRQAGQTIRKEDLKAALDDILASSKAVAVASPAGAAAAQESSAFGDLLALLELIWEVVNPAAAFERASQAVARGNLKVFGEIGREFARFITDLLNDQTPDATRLEQFCRELRPGSPPDGQVYLQGAFRNYYRAMFESDPKAIAELMLLANLRIGFHEQTRLQPEILEALNAGIIDPKALTRRIAAAILKRPARITLWRLLFLRLLGRLGPLEPVIDEFIAEVRQRVRQLITDNLMTLGMPRGLKLHLGEDLRAEFPELLKHIENPDLQALLGQIDPTPDSLSETGAVDWGDLAERIHFIADMFRSYAESPGLFDPPFNSEETIEIKAGRVPDIARA